MGFVRWDRPTQKFGWVGRNATGPYVIDILAGKIKGFETYCSVSGLFRKFLYLRLSVIE